MIIFIAILTAILSLAADITVSPASPVAGAQLSVTVGDSDEAQYISFSSPFGSWRRVEKLSSEHGAAVTLPGDLPVVLIAAAGADDIDVPHEPRAVFAAAGEPMPRAKFWMAYLYAGFPTPFPPASPDAGRALTLAREAVSENPADPLARELLWRVRALGAATEELQKLLLEDIDAELAEHPGGRLALAAAAICSMFNDAQRLQAIEQRHADALRSERERQQQRWNDINSIPQPRARIDKIHAWLREDPFNLYTPALVQILAPSYQAAGDYRSTVLFGMLSLRLTPGDAMTLNGVAYAMAEGGYQYERALVLANRAIVLLGDSAALNRPEGMSDVRWSAVMKGAQAAAHDTRGWLLTKLQRWGEAKEDFDQALSLADEDEFYLHYGIMLAGRGEREEAQKTLMRGLRLSGPHHAEIQAALDELMSK